MNKIKNIIYIPEPTVSLKDTVFEDCKMSERNLYKGNIDNCIFINCDLSESNFSKATIKNSKFINCYMQFCGMVRVQIYNCEFVECDLWHTNLCHSSIHETLFNKCILKALFKELDWDRNTYDNDTIIESCGGDYGDNGSHCGFNENVILDLINKSKRTVDAINY